MPNIFTVTTTSDNSTSGLTLSEAINDANADPGSIIDFSSSVFTPGNDTYTLTGSLPAITADVTIDGTTTDGQDISLDGGGQYQGLYVYSGTALIENLTLKDTTAIGQAGSNGLNGLTEEPGQPVATIFGGGGGGGGGGAGLGGGLLVGASASVALSNVAFESDSATGGQGGQPGYFDPFTSGKGGPAGDDGMGRLAGGAGGGFEADSGAGNSGGAGGQNKGAGGGSALFGAGGGGGGATGGGTFGGGGQGIVGQTLGVGGAGGFGGGGGGGGGSAIVVSEIQRTVGNAPGGAGGFGAGSGAAGLGPLGGPIAPWTGGAGGGGLGAGGDIFVEQGGSLTIDSGVLGTATVNGGLGGVAQGFSRAAAANGDGYGSGLFIQGNQSVTFAPPVGESVTIDGVIADQSGSGGTGNNAGTGSLIMDGAGTLLLTADNLPGSSFDPDGGGFTGGITIEAGTVELMAPGAAGSGPVTFDAGTLIFAPADAPNEIDNFGVGDSIQIIGFLETSDSYANGVLTLDGIDEATQAPGIVTLDIPGLALGDFQFSLHGKDTTIEAAPQITASVGQPVNGGTLELQGMGIAVGDTINLYADGNTGTVVGTGVVGAGGTFDITTMAGFVDGVHTFTATETNAAFLTSPQSTPAFTVDVDPNAPVITTLVAQAVTGGTVELQGTGENGDTIDLYADGNTSTVVGTGTVVGDTFDITTMATFAEGMHSFTATETDAADLTSPTSSPAFQVNVTHQAPAVTAGGAATFDGADAVALDAGVTVSDVDSGGTLAGATVSIGTGFLPGDTLNFTDQNGISGSYDAGTGVLTLSGTATLTQYQMALDEVSYSFSPAGGDATAGGTDTSRTINWQINDGSASNGLSNIATSTLSLPTTPVVAAAAANLNASANETFTPGQLFAASDAAGAPILTYEVEDESTGAANGFWTINGLVEPNGQMFTVTAAQLSQLSFTAGSAAGGSIADTLEVAASDSAGFGPFTTFTVTAAAHAPGDVAPTVSALISQALPESVLPASSVFGGTAFQGESVVGYEVEDTNCDWVFNGTPVAANQIIDVSAAQLSELTLDTGFGTDTLMVRANDDTQWGNFTTIQIAQQPNAAAPPGSAADMILVQYGTGLYEFYDIGSNTILAAGPLGQISTSLTVVDVGGFDGSDTADLLMRDPATGAFTLYDVSNNNITGNVSLGQVGPEWTVAGFGDFSSHAGETDMLMRNSNTGAFEVYDISNNAITSAAPMGQVGLEWTVAGFGDFSTRAGETDMLMRNSNTGAFELYDISNNTITSAVGMGQVGLEWTVAGFGDFSGHADETDMLMRNSNTGAFELYDISNNAITLATGMGQVGLEWTVAGFGDFSGNANETDMLMRNSNTGAFELYDISNNTITLATGMGDVGLQWSVSGIASLNGAPPSTQLSGTAADPAGASLSQLTPAMASFALVSGAAEGGISPGEPAAQSTAVIFAPTTGTMNQPQQQ